MLKTNSIKAIENIKKYIVDNFDCEGYETKKEPETFPEVARFILDCFHSEKYSRPEDYQYYKHNENAAFIDWCSGLPAVLDTCYYYNRSAVDDLGAILEETEEEKSKYTEDNAETLLTALIHRELRKAVK